MHHRQQETASYTITATSAHGLQSAITNLVPSYPCLSLSSHFACSSKCFVAALTNCIITALTYCIITAHCIITVLSWTVFIAALCYRTDFFFPAGYSFRWEGVTGFNGNVFGMLWRHQGWVGRTGRCMSDYDWWQNSWFACVLPRMFQCHDKRNQLIWSWTKG